MNFADIYACNALTKKFTVAADSDSPYFSMQFGTDCRTRTTQLTEFKLGRFTPRLSGELDLSFGLGVSLSYSTNPYSCFDDYVQKSSARLYDAETGELLQQVYFSSSTNAYGSYKSCSAKISYTFQAFKKYSASVETARKEKSPYSYVTIGALDIGKLTLSGRIKTERQHILDLTNNSQ